ncbi:MAG: hypothetical protein JSU95_02825 [Betaproteobacteria bacterium]|nr:MAG: hypothetical protein JSU95_02825 [Betaproteobacteria bacterium]
MSEHQHDDEELEKFLSRESTLSRRYRESGEEQPPAQVDAAILAASRWAVGADRTGAGRTGADRDRGSTRHTGSHYGASTHARTSWRRSRVARWSVPLAMAAVVVVAVTLTIMIERDPELDRIYQRYDSPAPYEGVAMRDSATAEADVAAPQTPTPAGKGVAPGLTDQAGKPAPALPPAKKEGAEPVQLARNQPTTTSPKATEETVHQLAQQDRLAARKRSEISDERITADQSVRRDAPAIFAEEQMAEGVSPAPAPAEPFPESISVEIEAAEDSDVGIAVLDETAGVDEMASPDEPASVDQIASPDEMASLDEAREESAFVGASALPEAEEPVPSSVTTPGRQQALAPEPATVLESDRELAESAQPAEIGAADSVRDPAQWIEEIEDLVAQGRRAEAIDSLEEFRLEYPDYELPPDLLALLPASGD